MKRLKHRPILYILIIFIGLVMLRFLCFDTTPTSNAPTPYTPVEAWQNNPEIFKINRLEARSTSMSYGSREEAMDNQRKEADRISDYYEVNHDREGWSKIEVPGHWQLQGYDYTQYVNIQYPWNGKETVKEGFAPVEYNPVGYYHREFEVNKSWDDQPVFISFQGVESAFYLYINGMFVGYSEDSFTPADFDLTPYLKKEINTIDVEVFRWCDASWLEDQDFRWKMEMNGMEVANGRRR